jgi:signal transduction histidine kinase
VKPVTSEYAAALSDHLGGGGEASLQRAYEIGRRAMGEGMGVLDVLGLHHEALDEIARGRTTPERAEEARAARQFLAETLSPFEMTHRGFREAVTALRRLNELLEEGAKRIAHALHDEAGQLLVSVHLALQRVAIGLPPRARERLQEIRHLLDEIEKQLRRLSHELRPTILDDLGLLPALDFVSQGVAQRSGIEITVSGPRDRRLPVPVETALYRIVQEALNNVCRHSQARRVEVRVHTGVHEVRCSIRDDGLGFDPAAVEAGTGATGLGLLGIKERVNALAGQLAIQSSPGRGTELSITIPLGDAHANSGTSRG